MSEELTECSKEYLIKQLEYSYKEIEKLRELLDYKNSEIERLNHLLEDIKIHLEINLDGNFQMLPVKAP